MCKAEDTSGCAKRDESVDLGCITGDRLLDGVVDRARHISVGKGVVLSEYRPRRGEAHRVANFGPARRYEHFAWVCACKLHHERREIRKHGGRELARG